MDKAQAERALQLSGTYSLADARAAYRALAKKYHPDMRAKSGIDDAAAEAGIRDVNEAFDYIEDLFKSSGRETIECGSPGTQDRPASPAGADFNPEDLADAVRNAQRATARREEGAKRRRKEAEVQERFRREREERERKAAEEQAARRARVERSATRGRTIKVAVAICLLFIVASCVSCVGGMLRHGVSAQPAVSEPRQSSQAADATSSASVTWSFSAPSGAGQGAFGGMSEATDEEPAFSALAGSYEEATAGRVQGKFIAFTIDSVEEGADGVAAVAVSWTWRRAGGGETSGTASGQATIDHVGPGVIATLSLYGTDGDGGKFQFRGSWDADGTIEYSAIVDGSTTVHDRVLRKS